MFHSVAKRGVLFRDTERSCEGGSAHEAGTKTQSWETGPTQPNTQRNNKHESGLSDVLQESQIKVWSESLLYRNFSILTPPPSLGSPCAK